jgi:hypothetical protein
MSRFFRSHIGRPIDPSSASNRYALAAAVLAGVVAGAVTLVTSGFGDAVRWGFLGGAGAFLAWAIAREVDPDDTVAAAVAAPLGLAALLVGAPGVAASAAVLIAARIMVRTTGRSPTPLDLVVLVAGAGYLGTQPVAWVPLAALVVAVAHDAVVTGGGMARLAAAPLAMVAAGVLGALVAEPGWSWTTPDAAALVVGIAGVVAALAALPTDHPRSVGDLTGDPLQHHRLVTGRVLVLAAGLGSFALLGGDGVAAVSPLWAAFAGVAAAGAWDRVGAGDRESAQA